MLSSSFAPRMCRSFLLSHLAGQEFPPAAALCPFPHQLGFVGHPFLQDNSDGVCLLGLFLPVFQLSYSTCVVPVRVSVWKSCLLPLLLSFLFLCVKPQGAQAI